MKGSVIIPAVVEERNHSFRLPRAGLSAFVTSGAASENVCFAYAFTKRAVSRKCIHHVADNRVLEAVPNEKNCESAEQLAQKTACPTFGEIRSSEIGACQDQRPAIGICFADSAMQVNNTVPDADFGHRELRRGVNLDTCGSGDLKASVEICGDQATHTFSSGSQSKQ